MSELLRQSVLEKNVCVASYVLWTEETKARVQVLYYQHHLWIIWWSQPLDFIWKSASTGTSRVLMQISLQPSSGFNPSPERHIKSSSQAGMKRRWKNRNRSRNLPLQFSMAHSFEKRKQSRASALKFYQRRRHKFLEGPGPKKNRVWYGEQSHQTRTMFNSLLRVQLHLISRVYML